LEERDGLGKYYFGIDLKRLVKTIKQVMIAIKYSWDSTQYFLHTAFLQLSFAK
jgi:hypothetical protein